MIEGRSIDVDAFTAKRVNARYPNIFIPSLNGTTPLVVELLEKGELPVIGEHNGQRRVICYISESAYNIDKLLRTHDVLKYMSDADSTYDVHSVREYLEVVSGWMV